jgi:pseudouridine synthase
MRKQAAAEHTRLQKVMAERGVASRRAAEELIAAGRVRVDGQVVRVLGTKVPPDARIEVDGEPTRKVGFRYIALHKPFGVVSTASDERGRPTVVQLVRGRERIYPVGRLDRDSEGLLLLTNDGDWAQRVIHPSSGHEREYEADVEGQLSGAALTQLSKGVRLEEGLARVSSVRVISRSVAGGRLRIVLRTGWKRQVRRMCAEVGLTVVRLRRVRIGPLRLGTLAAGAYRDLNRREVEALARA